MCAFVFYNRYFTGSTIPESFFKGVSLERDHFFRGSIQKWFRFFTWNVGNVCNNGLNKMLILLLDVIVFDFAIGRMVTFRPAQWLVLLPHIKRVLGLSPDSTKVPCCVEFVRSPCAC